MSWVRPTVDWDVMAVVCDAAAGLDVVSSCAQSVLMMQSGSPHHQPDTQQGCFKRTHQLRQHFSKLDQFPDVSRQEQQLVWFCPTCSTV